MISREIFEIRTVLLHLNLLVLLHFKSSKCKLLDQPDVKDTLYKLHANYVLVPADKAANNVIIVCKKYIDTLVKELGINNVNINNPTYIPQLMTHLKLS